LTDIAETADLVWCVEPHAFEPVRSLLRGRVVLELQNLHDALVRHQLASTYPVRADEPAPMAMIRNRWHLPRLAAKWEAWQRGAAAAVDAVVLCSELDAARVDAANGVVIPNAYPTTPKGAANRRAALRWGHTNPTIAFVGTMYYEPNSQAARYFAREVLPLVRASAPGARFRVIGHGEHLVDDLRSLPGVDVWGYQPDIGTALADVSVLVAPLFFGGGTRLKVLEGFARGIPVVSTTVGAEGLDARAGEHLLIADDTRAFAGAVSALLRNLDLGLRLTRNASALAKDRYAWARSVAAVERLARDLVVPSGEARPEGSGVASWT
jgi:glycosyltransferase involved in cell wall biosynthesis